ncbi:MAG TPA: hypothetical protein PLU45_05005, partial [Bacteroidales bacterium]|nr:hypothetical protein [Bacteroidales bacterium]
MLFEGEMLTYGQFPIQLTKISGGNGEFKGEGLMRVPYFNNARVRVTFESILVNELNQIYAGRVVSVYNPHSKFMVDDLGDYIPHNYQIGHIVDAKDSSEITLDYELLAPIVATMQGSTLRLQSQGGSSTHTIANAQHGTTLQDAAGKLYAVDANGNVRAIGISADSNASKQAPPPKDSAVWLTFTAPNATWAIDYYDAAYSSKHYTQSYKTFEGEPIAWKFVALGKADRIELHIPPQASIDHEQVQFVTTTGTELYADYSQNTYNLHIPSARSRDGYELIARLQHTDSSYTTIAMLHVAAYELQTRSLVIVPMQEKNHPSAEEIAHGLNNIYAPYGVQWQVRVDDAFTDQSWDEGKQGLQTQGSEFFSTYTSEMKNLHSVYESQRDVDSRSAYIFWFAQKSESSELLLGDMPLESRYGYVFSKALDQQAYHTIAHELAHGVFSLRHTFSKDYAIAQGSTRNLMDYPTAKTTNATELKKYQWDALHDPKKLIAPWMQNEEEGKFIYGITWLGNYLWGLAPDEQESQIETDRALFKHVHKNYDKYFNSSKTKDVNLTIESHKNWSVRKASHNNTAKKVFTGIKANNQTFTLHKNGIYFEEYTLNDILYKVVVYSKNEHINLTSDIRLESLSALRYNTSIKAGYADDYCLISFYDSQGKMQMTFQIFSAKPPKETLMQWLNYLGLLLPSKAQKEADTETYFEKLLSLIKMYSLDNLFEIWGEEIVKEEKKEILVNINQFKKDLLKSTEVATKLTIGTACNICVRSALYITKNDSALFPKSKSGYYDPLQDYKYREIEGLISGNGQAYYIKSDFDKLQTNFELNKLFKEIKKEENESVQDFFQRLQNDADRGIIIIGVMYNSAGTEGHIVTITPGG